VFSGSLEERILKKEEGIRKRQAEDERLGELILLVGTQQNGKLVEWLCGLMG